MSVQQRHGGIDNARFIAAVLVIAIHTSPFSTFSHFSGLLTTLTRTTARLAVPFFLMTSGYFLFYEQANDVSRLRRFLMRILCLYGAATALYLPVLIYTDYFNQSNLILNMLKDIIFDGTFYHLWYLPAAALGSLLVSFLIKKFGFRIALIISLMLYLIGMLGDSYYGLTSIIPRAVAIYQMLFRISDFTRNGIFFAPIFIMLGSLISSKGISAPHARTAGFLISYLLMLLESLVLNLLNMQRHDCMYLFLIPTSFFLFYIILSWKTQSHKKIRSISTTMYLFHPIIMLAIRFIAKLLDIQRILLENSMVYFCTTLTLSILVGYVVSINLDFLKKKG